MCCRRLSRCQKTSFIVFIYLVIYLIISYMLLPTTLLRFVSDEYRVGGKYALVYVVAPLVPVFTDAEGIDVFRSKGCGKCFITNNKGFLPMVEYDAILIYGERSLLTETGAFMDPEKRYLLETTKECISSRFKKCSKEPKITSFSSRKSFNLCGLCSSLRNQTTKHHL